MLSFASVYKDDFIMNKAGRALSMLKNRLKRICAKCLYQSLIPKKNILMDLLENQYLSITLLDIVNRARILIGQNVEYTKANT